MKTLFLIRHGKASLDGTERERGLTDEGIKHAEQITEILKGLTPSINKIYSSPYRRAILTMEGFAKEKNLEIKTVENLKEKETGDTSGENLNDIKRKMWDDFDYKLPNGESSNKATKRAIDGLQTILNDMQDNDSSAVQSHGTLIGLILHHFQPNFGFEDWKNMTMPDIFQINFDNEKVQVKHIGCHNIKTFKIGQK